LHRVLLSFPFLFSAAFAHGASFDCSKASTSIEKLVCSDPQLSELDSRLALSYGRLLADPAKASSAKAEQKAWIKGERDKCQNSECLKQVYFERLRSVDGNAVGNNASAVENSSAVQSRSNEVGEKPALKTIGEVATEAAKEGSESAPPAATNLEQSRQASVPLEAASTGAAIVGDVPKAVSKPNAEKNDGKPATPAEAKPNVSQKPDSTISDIAAGLLSLVIGLFFVGMVKPSWVLRWDKSPTRVKLVGYLFACGFPLGALTNFTKTDDRKKYDHELVVQKKAADDAIAQRQEVARVSYAQNKVSSKLVQSCVDSALDIGYTDGMCAYSYINACVTTQSKSEMVRMAALDKLSFGGRLSGGGCVNMPTTYVSPFKARYAQHDRF
jgi:uncharacterized protein